MSNLKNDIKRFKKMMKALEISSVRLPRVTPMVVNACRLTDINN